MIRGTTPDYILTVKGEDLTDKAVYVTFEQSGRRLTMTGNELGIDCDGTDSAIAIRLSQQQTLSLRDGAAKVQVRFISEDGTAKATEIKEVTVRRVLLEGVIQYDTAD